MPSSQWGFHSRCCEPSQKPVAVERPCKGGQCFHQKAGLVSENLSARCGNLELVQYIIGQYIIYCVVVLVKFHDKRQLKEEFILASGSWGSVSIIAGKAWQ